MPIYEYACQKCGDVIEVSQRITEPPLKRHNGAAKCGGKLTKLISQNSFQLKGTGWYKTDYANKGNKSSGGGSGAKSESAPAAAGSASAD